jgi:hypothetical protein
MASRKQIVNPRSPSRAARMIAPREPRDEVPDLDGGEPTTMLDDFTRELRAVFDRSETAP